jgi:hypothetical protein
MFVQSDPDFYQVERERWAKIASSGHDPRNVNAARETLRTAKASRGGI